MQGKPSVATPDDLLAFQLHRLASTFGALLHLDDPNRKDVASREGLDPYFGRNTLASKFIHVAQAVATLFTPSSKGQTNFAVMFGFTANETHIFYCKNGGGQDAAIFSHFRTIWSILQQLRQTRFNVDQSTDGKPSQALDDLLSKLCDLAYTFVASKALDRAKKRMASIDALFTLLDATPELAFEWGLVRFMRLVAHSAADAAKLRGQGQSDEAPWEIFRLSTLALLNHASTRAANGPAMEYLKRLSKGLPNDLSFNFEKCLDKMLKVESAVLTLYDLAVSPRRSHIVQNALMIHPVPLPIKKTTTISFSTLKDHFPLNSDIEQIKKEMCDAGTSSSGEEISILSTVHSECQLVAWVVQNLGDVASEVSMVPYVTCSKRHCFACFLWLQEFNRLSDPTLPHLAFDNSYGGLQPGWLPPSLKPSMQETILNKISSRLEEEFDKQKYRKESSASTTKRSRSTAHVNMANLDAYEATYRPKS
ncbi:hypothetical protein B0H13DRAFT_2485998 [Mycena leptocephala]|nr:hypothetical protein B0H13DRAFT_2485998 [Mycena leptocephala]